MPQEILNIIWSALGVLLTGLATWATTQLVAFLNRKIKDKDVAKWTTEITTIVMNAVQQVFQTYVESLKKEGAFTKEAQEEALKRCLSIITGQLTEDCKNYIEANFGDMKTWLITQIESAIYRLKNIETK